MISEYYVSRREDLIKFIPETAKCILDVGCGAGLMAEAIKEKIGADTQVTGLEVNPEAARLAEARMDRVIVGNIEGMDLPFEKEYFDCIIYGDVLEHLLDPWETLKKQMYYLKKNGYVIASIPNIAHYRIIDMLKRKEWTYKNAGILDRSHLRFFTLKSINSMFKDANLEIVKAEPKIGASNIKKAVNRIFLNSLIDHIAEQYIVVATKSPATCTR